MHTGQTGTETSRVNWAEGASSRPDLATPFPSGSLGTPSSFQLSADSQCAGVWRGQGQGGHTQGPGARLLVNLSQSASAFPLVPWETECPG